VRAAIVVAEINTETGLHGWRGRGARPEAVFILTDVSIEGNARDAALRRRSGAAPTWS
jgi:hypothetical protein